MEHRRSHSNFRRSIILLGPWRGSASSRTRSRRRPRSVTVCRACAVGRCLRRLKGSCTTAACQSIQGSLGICVDILLCTCLSTITRRVQVKYLKWAGVFALIFTIVLLGAIAGLIVGIVEAEKDTKSSVWTFQPPEMPTSMRLHVRTCIGAGSTRSILFLSHAVLRHAAH